VTARRYQRPSTKRSLEEQIGRIEALEFGNPLPCFRAWRGSEGTFPPATHTVAGDGTQTFLKWNLWDDGYDRRFFAPEFDSGGAFDGYMRYVALLVPGVYAMHSEITWDDSTFGGPQILALVAGLDSLVQATYADYFAGFLTFSPTVTDIRAHPLSDLDTAGPPFNTDKFGVTIQQNSGSPVDIVGDPTTSPCRFELFYLGGFTTEL